MRQRILPIQGHPGADHPYLAHVLEEACAQGAQDAGHEVRRLCVARLDFVDIAPMRETLIGQVDRLDEGGVAKLQRQMARLGRKAA